MLIGQLVKETGLTKHTIRHYESLGLIYASKTKAGTREYKNYNADTVERLTHIEEGKLMGLTLKEIKSALDLFMEKNLSVEDQIDIIERRVTSIDDKIAQLTAVRKKLADKLQKLKQCSISTPEEAEI